MNDLQIWQQSTGKPLELGSKVTVCSSFEFYEDFQGEEFVVVGIHFDDYDIKNKRINIAISCGDGCIDDFRIEDLMPVLRSTSGAEL